MSYDLQITFLKTYYQLYKDRKTHVLLLFCKTCVKSLNMNERGNETCDKENMSKHDVWKSITTAVVGKKSSTVKEMEKGMIENEISIKPYAESLENYNHQIRHDYERNKNTKMLEIEKLTESRLQKKREEYQKNSNSCSKHQLLISKRMKEYAFHDQSTIGQRTMSPDSTESTNSTEEFDSPVTSQASLNKRKISAMAEDSKNKKRNKKKVKKNDEKDTFPDSSTNLSESIPSTTLEVLKDLVYNCIKPPCTSTASISENQPNLGRIRVRNTQELCSPEWRSPLLLSTPVPVNGSLVNHLTSQQAQIKDCRNSSNVLATYDSSLSLSSTLTQSEHENIHMNREIHNSNIMMPAHVNNSNPVIQINRNIYERVTNPLSTNVTSIQNSVCNYSPSLTSFSNNPSTSFSPNYFYSPSPRHPVRANNERMSNSASFSSYSQALSSVQANLNSLGPINLQQGVAIPSLVQSTNSSNSNHRTYLVDLMQDILISIRSLNTLRKSTPTLNKHMAKQYFFENIMQLKRLFEKLAIHEKQTFSKHFINYVLQKFRDFLKFEPLISSYEVNCILSYQSERVKKQHKTKLTKFQQLVLKQQIESFEYITSWINDELTKEKQLSDRLNRVENAKRLVTNSSKASSEKDNVIGSDNSRITNGESTLHKTVSNNHEATVCSKKSDKMLEKTKEVASLNHVHDSTQTDAHLSSNTNLITNKDNNLPNKDNNLPNSRVTVIMRSERSPSPRTKSKQMIVESSDENSNPKNECVPVDQKHSVITLEHSQNDSICSLENESLNRFDSKPSESSEDNSSQITASATEVIELVEEELNSIIESASEIHNKAGSTAENLVHPTEPLKNSVVRLQQNFSPELLITSPDLEAHSAQTEHEESIVPDSAHSTEFNVVTVAASEELPIEQKLKYTSGENAIQEDIVENEKNLHSATQNNEKYIIVEDDVTVLDQDARNVESVDEYYVEDPQDTSVECLDQNQTKVPEILMVQSISCDQFDKLNSTEDNCDDSDSDSDTSSSCSIAELNETSCLLCNEESVIVCELCTKASYCSKMCQETHWEIVHHLTCKVREKDDDIIILD